MIYEIAEKFKSVQGEGLYAGTPMAFIRFVGCSVGKRICQHCDTDFDKTLPWRGGGEFEHYDLFDWAKPYEHICLTGGEPLDQDLTALLASDPHGRYNPMIHIETSGTKDIRGRFGAAPVWICVSPKPGFLEESVLAADEIKVIVPGLGSDEALDRMKPISGFALESPKNHPLADRETFRWPSLQDALRWAAAGKLVYLQPRNAKFDVDQQNLRYVQDLLIDHPNLRLSVQMHKILKVQ